jgi:hypothetical protein
LGAAPRNTEGTSKWKNYPKRVNQKMKFLRFGQIFALNPLLLVTFFRTRKKKFSLSDGPFFQTQIWFVGLTGQVIRFFSKNIFRYSKFLKLLEQYVDLPVPSYKAALGEGAPFLFTHKNRTENSQKRVTKR